MPAARREIMIAVKDGEPIRIEQLACGERIEHTIEQARVPAIEQISSDREVCGAVRSDAIEQSLRGAHVIDVTQMKIGQVRDQHAQE
jgi:hypothetical protein